MDLFANLALGFWVAVSAAEPRLLLHRCAGRHADRRAARHRPADHDRDAAADHLQRAAGRRAHHAGRHLLRRAVRRLDDVHPGEPARRDVVRRHLPRRLPDGAAGPRRTGAGDRGHRLVLRRHRRHAADRRVRASAGRVRPQVRRARVLLADADGPGRRGRARAGRHYQVAGDGGRGPPAWPRRHRRQHRRARFAFESASSSTESASSWWRSACSPSARSSPTSVGPSRQRLRRQDLQPVADWADFRQSLAPILAAPPSARSSACCQGRARRLPRSRPTCSSRSWPRTPHGSAGAPSRAWPGRKPPTMPSAVQAHPDAYARPAASGGWR